VCDLITLHTPLTNSSYGLIGINELKLMKPNALLVNTSRGGIVNEIDLVRALKTGLISGAAIDVFETEPYRGILSECENCLLSSHMGSMSEDCRAGMEIQATEEIVRHFRGERLIQLVPESEYSLRFNNKA
jgi:D-3-phosphoglycerate dehydrogenase